MLQQRLLLMTEKVFFSGDYKTQKIQLCLD